MAKTTVLTILRRRRVATAGPHGNDSSSLLTIYIGVKRASLSGGNVAPLKGDGRRTSRPGNTLMPCKHRAAGVSRSTPVRRYCAMLAAQPALGPMRLRTASQEAVQVVRETPSGRSKSGG
jgi:hypothetical protein